jgi:hypothetical protein
MRAITRVERGNRPRIDLDRDRRGDGELVERDRFPRRLGRELRARDVGQRGRRNTGGGEFQQAAT